MGLFEGVSFVNSKIKEPEMSLPEDCSGKSIVLRLTGGVGDVLMALAGSAEALKLKWWDVNITVACMEHQIDLLQHIPAIDDIITAQSLNNPKVRSKYDVLIEFGGCFANKRQIKNQEYYSLVSEKLGIDVRVPQFNVERCPTKINGRPVVAIHPGSSNPNRRWPESRWREVTEYLVDHGCDVLFLGTFDEFAMEGACVKNASMISDALDEQLKLLSTCHYFIGNDSGFAHMAGMLGIPGTVLFFTTVPEHVLHHYPTLQPAEVYGGDLIPSRELRGDCPHGKKAIELLTAEKVLELIPWSSLLHGKPYDAHVCTKVTDYVQPEKGEEQLKIWDASKPKIAAVAQGVKGTAVALGLREWFDVEMFASYPKNGVSYVAVVTLTDAECYFQIGDRTVLVEGHSPELIRRAIREVSNA